MTTGRSARPWDIFNKNLELPADIAEKRFEICKGCEHFLSATTQCTKCGCLMKNKTRLATAECPIGLWHQERVTFKENK